jgi:hypothetical protein
VHPRGEPCTKSISNINNAGQYQEPAVTGYTNRCFIYPTGTTLCSRLSPEKRNRKYGDEQAMTEATMTVFFVARSGICSLTMASADLLLFEPPFAGHKKKNTDCESQLDIYRSNDRLISMVLQAG